MWKVPSVVHTIKKTGPEAVVKDMCPTENRIPVVQSTHYSILTELSRMNVQYIVEVPVA
jgi:hypothetical protein